MLDPSRTALENRYRNLRQVARQAVAEEFSGKAGQDLRLTEIGEAALVAVSSWKNRRVNWDWARLVRKFRRRHRRVELAIWINPLLCGLVIGKISDGRVVARIDFIERAPGNHALVGMVGEIATVYLETLGQLAGCREAVISFPAQALLDFYRLLGYTEVIMRRDQITGLKKFLPVSSGREGGGHEKTET